jgi:hypothetical protein
MIRGLVSIAGLMASLAALSDGFRRIAISGPANNPSVLFENMMKSANEDVIGIAAVFFIVSIVLLAWPAKKKEPRYISVDNSNGGLN